jgi:probable HAF family extracellular repeat protein
MIVGTSGHKPTLFDPTGFGENIGIGPDGQAYSVNNNDRIVGSVRTGGCCNHAVLFNSPVVPIIDLGTLGGNHSAAYSINDVLQIVGWATDDSGRHHATLFDHTGGGNNIDLGSLGAGWGYAFSINNHGQVVGWSADITLNSHATLFYPGDPCSNISLTPGWMGCAFSINDNGQIVGFVGDAPADYEMCYDFPGAHATLFDSTGGGNNIYLGELGGPFSCAFSVNNNGQIVGSAWTNGIASDVRACLFDSTGGEDNVDLNFVIDENLGWDLKVAYSINDEGQIVGYGINPDGEGRAFLLNPGPPPAASATEAWAILVPDLIQVAVDPDKEPDEPVNQYITALIEPPEGLIAGDIDANSVALSLDGVPLASAQYDSITDNLLIVQFPVDLYNVGVILGLEVAELEVEDGMIQVIAAGAPTESVRLVHLTVLGESTDGNIFAAPDTIRIISADGGQSEAKDADINSDRIVNFRDLSILAKYWLQSY